MQQRIILVVLGVMAGSLWALNEGRWVEFSQQKFQSHATTCAPWNKRTQSSVMSFQRPEPQTTTIELKPNSTYIWNPSMPTDPSEVGALRGCARSNDSLPWIPWDLESMRFFIDTSSSYAKGRYGVKWATWLPGTLLRYIPEKPEVERVLGYFLQNLDSTMVRVAESDLPRFIDIFVKDSAGRVDAFRSWVAPRVIQPADSTGLYYMDTTGIDTYFKPDVSEEDSAWVIHRIYSYCDERFINQIKGLTYRVSRNGVVKIIDEHWFLLGQRFRVRMLSPCNWGSSCGG